MSRVQWNRKIEEHLETDPVTSYATLWKWTNSWNQTLIHPPSSPPQCGCCEAARWVQTERGRGRWGRIWTDSGTWWPACRPESGPASLSAVTTAMMASLRPQRPMLRDERYQTEKQKNLLLLLKAKNRYVWIMWSWDWRQRPLIVLDFFKDVVSAG